MTKTDNGWAAHLTLALERSESGRTRLKGCRHSGPLQVQRPFYPEPNGTCHLYILHPPGGVVGGDRLTVDVELASGAEALLTTPAAGKFYRSQGANAYQTQILRVAEGAVLEWLPQETIVYQGARGCALTRVELIGDAGVIGWEILCLGRPAAGEGFAEGSYRQSIEIWHDGAPRYLEQGRLTGGSALLSAPWGLQGRPVTASLFCITRRSDLVDTLRAAFAGAGPDERLSVSLLDGVLICRYLGASTERARRWLCRAWTVLRPALLGKPVCIPRIWNT